MNEVRRIQDQLKYAFEGPAWHGKSLRELLDGVDAALAAARPIAEAHSIWEIVLHIRAWNAAVLRRLQGDPAELPPEEDWPPTPSLGASSWHNTLRALDEAHRQLWSYLEALDDRQLELQAAGNNYTVYYMLHGLIHHNLYHAGQIALLKKR